MTLTLGNKKYEWIDNWAKVVNNESGRENGRTHGVQETSAGEIVVFCQAEPSVLFFDKSGTLLRSWGKYYGAHGLTLTNESGTDYLWLADEHTCQVVKTTLDGEVLLSLKAPVHPVYQSGGKYIPTWVAINEPRFEGNGDIWVADGYGSSLVHRYASDGTYLSSIDGTTGAGHFACPHGIFFDHRGGSSRLLVADRSNHRIQAFDPEGKFIKSFGDDVLIHPDCFSTLGDQLLVPELLGRVTVLDANDELVGYLGEKEGAADVPGWPNLTPDQLEVGKFSSPHGGTFDKDGNIYIVEWIVGGRITKLELKA